MLIEFPTFRQVLVAIVIMETDIMGFSPARMIGCKLGYEKPIVNHLLSLWNINNRSYVPSIPLLLPLSLYIIPSNRTCRGIIVRIHLII